MDVFNDYKTAAGVLVAICVSTAVSAEPPQRFFDSPWMGYDTAVYPEGLDAWSSRVADFNGDSIPDLACPSWGGTPYLSILIGDGYGGYLTPVTYELQKESLDLEVADFDNDGDIDIVTVDTGRFWEGMSVSLYRNDGAGNFFLAAVNFTADNGPSSITAADFDDDGFIDIAMAHDEYIAFGNTMTVMRNNGGNGFVHNQLLILNPGTRAIDSGDVDGDGDPDIVIGHETNRFTVLENTNGFFTVGASIPGVIAGSIPELPTIHLSDMDSDGDLDLFFSNQDTGGFGAGSIGFWRNLGGGSFGAGQIIPFGVYTGGGIDIETADVTHDGIPDVLAVTGGWGNWFLIPGDGEGGFEPAQRYRAGDAPISVEATDLENDGDRDVIVVAARSLEACVYLNPGDGGFIQPPVVDMTDPGISPAFTTNLESGDVDNDGDLDLVIGYRSDFSEAFGFSVRRNQGDGSFSEPELYEEFTYARYVRLRDLDNDDDLDIIWIDSGSRLRMRLNNGDGTYGPRTSSHTVGSGEYLDLHDVDNDGDLDCTVGAGFALAVLLNNGNATFGAPMYQDIGSFFEFIGMGDFNEDGNLDLLTDSGIQGYPQISNGRGDGTFDPPNTVSTGRDVHAFAVGHIDHDDHLDFAVVFNLDETGLSIRRGRGDGNFFASESYHGSYDASDHESSLKLADVDSDGHLDALTVNVGAQDLSFWKGNGDGTFEELVRYGVGQEAYDLAVADFTGDGIIDVAVITQAMYDRWFYPGVILLRGLGEQTGPLGDVDGDGDVDAADLALLLGSWGPCSGCPADLNGDGDVNAADLALLLGNWG